MPRRIGLIGGECTGKSTLAVALAEELPACLVTEALRDFVERERRTPHPDEQRILMDEQAAREDAAASSCRHDVVVCDPAPLMTAVYSALYFDDRSLVDDAVAHAEGYDLLVWCAPDLPWADEPGQRDGPVMRDRAESILADLVAAELLPRAIPVVRVVGDLTSRVRQARRAWQPEPPEPPT